MKYQRVCAWCKKDIGTKDGCESERTITHGICSLCLIKVTTGIQPRSASQILNYVQEPVFLIDANGIVIASNESGSISVGKKIEQIEYILGGEVFECTYALAEGGCGKSVHCKTCAIRNIVMDTLSTNRGYKNVPAYQSINTSDGPELMRFLISTEKVGEQILLRIDEMCKIIS